MFKLKRENSLLIEKINVEEKTAGGLIIPSNDSSKEVLKGKLVTTSEDVTGYTVNDILLYKKTAYTIDIPVQGETYTILDVDDVVAVDNN